MTHTTCSVAELCWLRAMDRMGHLPGRRRPALPGTADLGVAAADPVTRRRRRQPTWRLQPGKLLHWTAYPRK